MNHKGLTLVEIVVSMLILAVAALAVASTMGLINSEKMRSAGTVNAGTVVGGGSMELQALGYAREALDELRNVVSTDATRHAPLAGAPAGTLHDSTTDAANPLTVLPPCDLVTGTGACDLLNHSGTRKYTVWDVDVDGDTVSDYQKVTVEVAWVD